MLSRFDNYHFPGCHDPGVGPKPGIQKSKNRRCGVIPESLDTGEDCRRQGPRSQISLR